MRISVSSDDHCLREYYLSASSSVVSTTDETGSTYPCITGTNLTNEFATCVHVHVRYTRLIPLYPSSAEPCMAGCNKYTRC